MPIESTESLNPITCEEVFDAMIARLMVEIARGVSLVRQRSMMLQLTQGNIFSPSPCGERLDDATASILNELRTIAAAHGLDPLNRMGLTDLELVRLEVAPLDRLQNPPPAPAGRHPLDTFTDGRIVEALRELRFAIGLCDWLSHSDTGSPHGYSPEEAGALVLDRLAKATAAVERREEAQS